MVEPAWYRSVVHTCRPAQPLASMMPARLRNHPAILPTELSWASEGLMLL